MKTKYCFIQISFRIQKKLQRPLISLIFTGLTFILFFTACHDIFETDLSGKKVVLLAPGDSLRTEYGTQTFYWEELDGALTYNLQVATPSFSRIEQLIVDTTVSSQKFTMNLTPGMYEWRVRAQNGSSKTEYVTRSLQIDSTMDLTKQKVLLNSPSDGIATNIKKIFFSWSLIYNATGYNFQVWQPDLSGTKVIDTTITSINVTMGASLADGNYTWGVKAFNNNTNTDMVARKIMIDRTVPTIIPTLTAPQNKAQLTSWPVNLTWNRADSDGGSNLYDSVYVAIDTFFTTKVTAYKSITKSQSITLSDDTTYFWKVKTIDEAGNRGMNSITQKFSIKTK
jgi:hypothetical protein